MIEKGPQFTGGSKIPQVFKTFRARMFNQSSKPVLQYQYRYAATDDESGQKLEKVVVVKKKQR